MTREELCRAVMAVCRKALELGKELPPRRDLAAAMGVDEKALMAAFRALTNSKKIIVRGPQVVMVVR